MPDPETPADDASTPNRMRIGRNPIAKRIQRIRNPGVVKRLMALIDILAGTKDDEGDKGAVQVERATSTARHLEHASPSRPRAFSDPSRERSTTGAFRRLWVGSTQGRGLGYLPARDDLEMAN